MQQRYEPTPLPSGNDHESLMRQIEQLIVTVKLQQIKRGLTKSQLSKLKRMKMGTSSKICAICLQGFDKGTEIRVLPCKHIFHSINCVDKWLHQNTNCPLCKVNVRNLLT